MAGYECGLCQGNEQATLLITPLTGGETMPVGPGCMAVAFTGMLAGHLDLDPDKVWASIERVIKAEAAKATKPPARAAKTKPNAPARTRTPPNDPKQPPGGEQQ